MKNRDEKMRQRFLDREDERLLRKVDKQIRKDKISCYGCTDRDAEQDEAYQLLLNLKAQLEGR